MSGGQKAVGKLFEEGKGHIMQDSEGSIMDIWSLP